MRRIKLTENDLNRIVTESVKQILKETYKGDLYHFTNLEGIYGILEDDCLSVVIDADEEKEVVCLSRTGNPYLGYTPNTNYNLIFRITLDTEKMSSSIRGMKIKPWASNNPRTYKIGNEFSSASDYEERAYKSITPLHEYCKSIDVFPLHKNDRFDDRQIKILKNLLSDFPQWRDKIKIA